jgi:hypothetical protein
METVKEKISHLGNIYAHTISDKRISDTIYNFNAILGGGAAA